jgi:hypothetical protein
MHAAEAQTQPEATDPLHHPAAELPGEEVPREAVPLHLGAGRVLQPAQAHRDPGQDLVPKQARQDQTDPGVGNRTDSIRVRAPHATSSFWHPAVVVTRRAEYFPPVSTPGRANTALLPGQFVVLEQQ